LKQKSEDKLRTFCFLAFLLGKKHNPRNKLIFSLLILQKVIYLLFIFFGTKIVVFL